MIVISPVIKLKIPNGNFFKLNRSLKVYGPSGEGLVSAIIKGKLEKMGINTIKTQERTDEKILGIGKSTIIERGISIP